MSKHYAAAARAFDEAVRARPYDAEARAERAYVRILDGKGSVEELQLARALAVSPVLEGEIAFNEGLFYDKQGDKDDARRAFVEAERFGSKAATRKLGKASRCTVTAHAGALDLQLVHSWKSVLQVLGSEAVCPDAPHPATGRAARAYACGGCAAWNKPWEKGTCYGAPPWIVQVGYMDCVISWGLIQPLGGGRFYVTGSQSSQPVGLTRDRRHWVLDTPHKYVQYVEGEFSDGRETAYHQGRGWDDRLAPGDCPEDERHVADMPMSMTCDPSLIATYRDGDDRAYYDSTGRPLATVHLRDGDAQRVKIRFRGKRLTITGGGCHLVVPLH